MNICRASVEIALNSFGHLSLDGLNGKAPLLKRVDRKYIFRPELLLHVLECCKKKYDVLHINGEELFYYQTHYFDTTDLYIYFAHHNGKANRHKIRKRIYSNNDTCFLEVKTKDNKGNTIKHRKRVEPADSLARYQSRHFLSGLINVDPAALQQVITVNYTRVTLLSRDGMEKVTLDISPEFSNARSSIQYDNVIIAEVKSEKAQSSFFSSLMKQSGVLPGSVSKYCLGMVTLNDELKHNNFKLPLKRIQKINGNGIM